MCNHAELELHYLPTRWQGVCPAVRQAKGTGGARGYLAVSGGLDMPVYLGSRATFPGGKLGGVQACTVQADAVWRFGIAHGHSPVLD
jgi:allophanate hydrolase subunit 2